MSESESHPTGNQPTEPPAGSGEPGPAERQWAMFAHLSALIGFVIPFGTIIGPLIVWQMKKNEMPFVAEQAVEALNFQITVAIAFLISALLSVILIGFLLMPLIGLGALVLTIIAGIQANQGTHYEYPVNWRVVK
jgi:uncharacterized Tic20 family protein